MDLTKLTDDELKAQPALQEFQRREKAKATAYHEAYVQQQKSWREKCLDKLKADLLKLRPSLPVNDENFLGDIICAVQEYLDDIS